MSDKNDKSFVVKRNDDEKFDTNVRAVISEIESLLGRIRENEGVETQIIRKDTEKGVGVRVSISDHEAVDAILEKIDQILRRMGRRKRLEIESHVHESV